jgi:hypothetical protein
MTTADEAAIDYDRVWADYLASLVGTLRGFSSGIADLDSWVPSEDPLVSLRDLLDAAASAGRQTLAVRFGPASRPRLEEQAVGALAARHGHARILESPAEMLVVVEKLTAQARSEGAAIRPPPPARAARAPAPSRPLSSSTVDAYAPRLQQALGTIRHGIAAAPLGSGKDITATASDDGSQLRLEVDPTSHTITSAHFAAAAPETRALLDVFCDLITGLPLLEAAQHGVLRLEAALRDPAAPPPVPGIILPRAAHPRFALPAALIAQALASYRARTGYAEVRIDYHLAPSPQWQAAPPAARAAAITAVLAASPTPGVTLAAIEHDVRIVLRLPEHLSSPARQSLLMTLERAIRGAVDPRLEVHAEERKDRNKLRRLAVVTA